MLTSSIINNRLVKTSIFLTILIMVITVVEPSLDIKFSDFFYNADKGFFLKHNYFTKFFYFLVPILTKSFLVICAGLLIFELANYFISKDNSSKASRLRLRMVTITYLILTIALGPGLIVNSLLKDNIGRARPLYIKEFSGSKEFTPALYLSDQCRKNCSFSSGHAAMAFVFTNIAYGFALIRRNKNNIREFNIIYASVLIFGISVGMSRIIAGGHFLSDVAASAFMVLFINHILFLCAYKISQASSTQ